MAILNRATQTNKSEGCWDCSRSIDETFASLRGKRGGWQSEAHMSQLVQVFMFACFFLLRACLYLCIYVYRGVCGASFDLMFSGVTGNSRHGTSLWQGIRTSSIAFVLGKRGRVR